MCIQQGFNTDGFRKIPRLDRSWESRLLSILETAPGVKPGIAGSSIRFLRPSGAADAVEPFGEATFFDEFLFQPGELTPEQKGLLIDEADHHVGGDLGFSVGLVRSVRFVRH